MGFTYRVALREPALARFDPREVLRVRGQRRRDLAPVELDPLEGGLLLFNRRTSWSETDYVRSWPTDHQRESCGAVLGPRHLSRCRVVGPVCRNAVLPCLHRASALETGRSTARGLGRLPYRAAGARCSVDVVQVIRTSFRRRTRGAPGGAPPGNPTAGDAGLDLRARGNRREPGGNRAGEARTVEAYFARSSASRQRRSGGGRNLSRRS